MFTIKTTQKLLRTSGDPAQEMIESQVMELDPPAEEHLMAQVMAQLVADPQMAMAQAMAQLVAQVLVMAQVQTVGTPAAVLLTALEAQVTVLVMAQVPVTQVGILEVA
ncbi:MAG: hypothetical protein HN867_11535 [Deltaproteobacteria bacterium]|nr:hypothetical protein [Deltaproteobacteria bacterium]